MISGLLFGACQKEECEDPIPVISLEKVELNNSVPKVTFSVIDCDGDIGLEEADTAGAFQYNTFVDIRPFRNGAWDDEIWNYVDTSFREVFDSAGLVIRFDTIIDTLNYYYRVPFIDNNSRTEIYEAEVDLELGTSYFGFDTFRFEIYIKDRALNSSNVVVSETQISSF